MSFWSKVKEIFTGHKAAPAIPEWKIPAPPIPEPTPEPIPVASSSPPHSTFSYWDVDRTELIARVQRIKRQEVQSRGYLGPMEHSFRYVERNPMTGAEVPLADLEYAAKHLAQIYESGAIREDRWAFLWYH